MKKTASAEPVTRPTIALTRQDLLRAAPALQALGKASLGWKQTIRVTQLLRAAAPVIEETQRGHAQIVEEHARRTEDGQLTYAPGDGDVVLMADPKAAREALQQLLTEPVELPGAPFELKDLRDLKTPSRTVLDGAQLAALGPLLIIPDDIPEAL
jgi:hypothetical protein